MLLRVESLTRIGVVARGWIDISQQDRRRQYSIVLRAVALRNYSDGLDVRPLTLSFHVFQADAWHAQ